MRMTINIVYLLALHKRRALKTEPNNLKRKHCLSKGILSQQRIRPYDLIRVYISRTRQGLSTLYSNRMRKILTILLMAARKKIPTL